MKTGVKPGNKITLLGEYETSLGTGSALHSDAVLIIQQVLILARA